jgi:peptidoglycan hydrolase-like protein with peptidoglycan-binding domain
MNPVADFITARKTAWSLKSSATANRVSGRGLQHENKFSIFAAACYHFDHKDKPDLRRAKMKFNRITYLPLITTLAFSPAHQAVAGDGLVGGIVGGIIGGVIVNEANKNRRVTTTRRATQPVYSAQREANREMQVALNYFGYAVGTPDGSIGPRSRAAISQYQAQLGYPPTGQITEYERSILVGAYYRGVAGGAQVAQIMASSPLGARGLLIAQRDEMAGVAPQTGQVASDPAPEAPATLPVLAAAPEATTEGALPSFLGSGGTQVSLASQCNKVSLMTNTNGGYVKAAAMTDANFALGEQFCLARTYAMAEGEQLAGAVQGFTAAQIAEQCKGFGPALKNEVSALSLKPREEVLQDVSAFIVKSGMAPAQLAGTAKICLGVGYTTDAMDVAIGSALLLSALGENGYSELLGHHLSQGFGATVRPDLSLAWYEAGIAADQAGKAVFAPGLPDRIEVIRKAAYTINGRGDLAQQPAALPVFSLTPAPATATP